jgi:hypothetical protein
MPTQVLGYWPEPEVYETLSWDLPGNRSRVSKRPVPRGSSRIENREKRRGVQPLI